MIYSVKERGIRFGMCLYLSQHSMPTQEGIYTDKEELDFRFIDICLYIANSQI